MPTKQTALLLAALCCAPHAIARTAAPAASATLRGVVQEQGGSVQMQRCGGGTVTLSGGAEIGALHEAISAARAAGAKRVFAEVETAGKGQALAVTRLRRAHAEGLGCREELRTTHYVAFGNQPVAWHATMEGEGIRFWRIGDRQPPRVASRGQAVDGGMRFEAMTQDGPLSLTITPGACADAKNGARLGWSARAELDGVPFSGCAYAGDLAR